MASANLYGIYVKGLVYLHKLTFCTCKKIKYLCEVKIY